MCCEFTSLFTSWLTVPVSRVLVNEPYSLNSIAWDFPVKTPSQSNIAPGFQTCVSVQKRKVLKKILVKRKFKSGDWNGEEVYQERPADIFLYFIPIFFSD